MFSSFIPPSLPPSICHALPLSLFSLTCFLPPFLPPSLLHSLTHSLTPSLTHSLPPSLPPSLTPSLLHSLTHSLTHSLPPTAVDPVIDTIFPAPGVSSTAHSTIHYSVPLEFTGTALTCSGFGWPPLSIQWTKDSGPLPSGVSSAVTKDGGRVGAKLVFETPFSSSFVGVYKCEIKLEKEADEKDEKDENDADAVSQLIELSLNSSANAQTHPLFFQLHVFSRGCGSWTLAQQAQILREFHDLLVRVVLPECNCKVSRHNLFINSLQCSYFINGGSVFRGYVDTSSSSLSRTIFCTLLQWQKSGSFVSLNASLFAVDSQYSLQPSSYARVECGAKDEAVVHSQQTDLNNTASVLSAFVLVFMSCVVAVALVVLACWVWRRKGKRIL